MTDLAWALRHARERLADGGTLAPRAEAERLVAHVFGTRWGELWTRLSDPLDQLSFDRLDRVLDRRLAGEPVAYIEGTAPFWGMEVACGRGVLVPRPETETLVEVALELIGAVDRPVVADVGTGTGAVALAIARERADAEVWATDLSDEALRWARRNASRWAPKVRLARGDLFAALPGRLRGRLDLVVSNPPYVPDGAELPLDVSSEPRVALRAGPVGDELLLRLCAGATPWLREGGALACEVGTPEQARTVEDAVRAFAETGVRHDLVGRPRVVWGRL